MKSKHLVLILAFVLIAVNSLAGCIMEAYETSAFLMADLSMCFTTGLLYYLFSSDISDGFKIGLTVLFSITGIIRMICAVGIGTEMQNNVALLSSVSILLVEIGIICVVSYLSKK